MTRPSTSPAAAPVPGLRALMAAQSSSALADHALLLVALGLLQARGWPLWWAPLLKFGFNLAYVALAPWAGAVADACPKARLMAWTTALKLGGLLAMAAGLHPVAALAVVGVGAALQAPAKYGLVCELVPPGRLVAANAGLEVGIVSAALVGAVLGGLLAGPGWTAWTGPWALDVSGAGLPGAVRAALGALAGVYLVSMALNRGVPESGVPCRPWPRHPGRALRRFARDHRRLWADPQGGLALAAVALFWGLAATLQLLVLRWAEEALGLGLDRAAPLQAAVGLGVALGAWAAGRWVPLGLAHRLLWAGVAMGLLMPVLAVQRSLAAVLPALLLVGAVGGLMVVPVNALLQHRGHRLMGAGRSVAVQGFAENASVLAMLAGYAALLALDLSATALLSALGLAAAALLLGLIALGARFSRRRPSRGPGGDAAAARR